MHLALDLCCEAVGAAREEVLERLLRDLVHLTRRSDTAREGVVVPVSV